VGCFHLGNNLYTFCVHGIEWHPIGTKKHNIEGGESVKVLQMQRIAIDYLLMNNDEAVYTKNSISKTSFYRLLKKPEFLEILQEQSEKLFNETVIKAQSISLEALETLREIMKDKKAPCASRVAAARTIIDHAVYFDERTTILDRIEALEEIEQCREV